MCNETSFQEIRLQLRMGKNMEEANVKDEGRAKWRAIATANSDTSNQESLEDMMFEAREARQKKQSTGN